jgi:hypothetical protein
VFDRVNFDTEFTDHFHQVFQIGVRLGILNFKTGLCVDSASHLIQQGSLTAYYALPLKHVPCVLLRRGHKPDIFRDDSVGLGKQVRSHFLNQQFKLQRLIVQLLICVEKHVPLGFFPGQDRLKALSLGLLP